MLKTLSRITVPVILSAAAAALLFSGAPARAQDQGAGEGTSRFKLVFAFPTDGDTKDVVGNPVFGFGFSHDLPNSVAKGGPAVLSIYLDGVYAGRTKNSITCDMRYLGLGPAVRFYPGRKAEAQGAPPKPSQFYLGGGFGAYFIRYLLRNEFTGTTTEDTSSVKFGGKVQAGVDVGKVGFVEVEYAMPGVGKANSINLNFGARFGGQQ